MIGEDLALQANNNYMILEIILALTIITVVVGIANLLDIKYGVKKKELSMEVQLPGNLPIMALSNNTGYVMNFLIDSGSNISHICAEYYEDLDAEMIGVYENGEVAGLGATNTGITMCKASLYDAYNQKYNIDFSVSEQLSAVAKNIETSTGVKIHGLLGTDFLKNYNCVIDFKSLVVYKK